jgi:hypothetical protein
VPEGAFTHVHVDIVGPLPTCRGATHLLTVIDRSTRWPEALPLSGITAEECAHAFCLGWVARFGVPLHITSDRGRQFTSNLWTHLATMLGTKLHHTTAYHPQSNGLVERLHRTLKTALKARLALAGQGWLNQLPWVLLSLRTTPKEDLKFSPAALTMRHSPLLPGTLLSPSPPTDVNFERFPRHHCSPQTSTLATLKKSSHVFIRVDGHRAPFDMPYRGPFLVISRNEKTFTVNVNGREEVVSIDRLKPACLPSPTVEDERPVVCTRSGRTVRPPQRFS